MPGKINISQITLIIALMMVSLSSVAQNKVVTLPLNADKRIEYVENVAIPGASQSALYKKALNWIVGSKAYKFRKINMMDNTFGRIIAEGKFILNNEEVFLLVTVDVKQNRSQLKVARFDYNMQVGNVPLDNLTNTKANAVKTLTPLVADAMKKLIAEFKAAITKKP
jgi:hypothetical protein